MNYINVQLLNDIDLGLSLTLNFALTTTYKNKTSVKYQINDDSTSIYIEPLLSITPLDRNMKGGIARGEATYLAMNNIAVLAHFLRYFSQTCDKAILEEIPQGFDGLKFSIKNLKDKREILCKVTMIAPKCYQLNLSMIKDCQVYKSYDLSSRQVNLLASIMEGINPSVVSMLAFALANKGVADIHQEEPKKSVAQMIEDDPTLPF